MNVNKMIFDAAVMVLATMRETRVQIAAAMDEAKVQIERAVLRGDVPVAVTDALSALLVASRAREAYGNCLEASEPFKLFERGVELTQEHMAGGLTVERAMELAALELMEGVEVSRAESFEQAEGGQVNTDQGETFTPAERG
jgi:hypothetical protein